GARHAPRNGGDTGKARPDGAQRGGSAIGVDLNHGAIAGGPGDWHVRCRRSPRVVHAGGALRHVADLKGQRRVIDDHRDDGRVLNGGRSAPDVIDVSDLESLPLPSRHRELDTDPIAPGPTPPADRIVPAEDGAGNSVDLVLARAGGDLDDRAALEILLDAGGGETRCGVALLADGKRERRRGAPWVHVRRANKESLAGIAPAQVQDDDMAALEVLLGYLAAVNGRRGT